MKGHYIGGIVLLVGLTALNVIHTTTGDTVPKCVPKSFGHSSFVCVCNATYCDEVESNERLAEGQLAAYTSTPDGSRLDKCVHSFNPDISQASEYEIDRSTTYQTILGFGGAFTDATGINIASLSPDAGDKILAAYFGPTGLEYTIGRIPMASCDFSTRVYSYAEVADDFQLKHFALAPEDFKYKINNIHAARKLSGRPIRLFASPWSSPGWMKYSGKMQGNGTLIGQPGGLYYETWAYYFVRFLQEYEKQNVSIWGVTAQNEPTTGYFPNYAFQTLGFTAASQRDFIAKDLGPTMERNGFGHIKIMILDDQRINLPQWPKTVMASPEASKYVSGIAVHWYADFVDPAFPLSLTHNAMPDKFILYTEACEGYAHWKHVTPVMLGEWDRFETYANNIMDDLANWVVGWTDWNMALDLEGGPNWVKNFVDSPIIVNKKRDEFYKQPMFYALGHFSKFLPSGCVRVGLKKSRVLSTVKILAFSCPDQSTVVQISNSASSPQSFNVKDPIRGVYKVSAPPKSMVTLVWW